MPISTKLFNDQAIMRFNRLTSDIQNTQGKIATGKNCCARRMILGGCQFSFAIRR